jgi:hypothetical protein
MGTVIWAQKSRSVGANLRAFWGDCWGEWFAIPSGSNIVQKLPQRHAESESEYLKGSE